MKRALALLTLLFPALAFACHLSDLSFTELMPAGAKEHAQVDLASLSGDKTIMVLWRGDCAPCREELKLMPKIAHDNPKLSILLVSLPEVPQKVQYMPPKLPKNVYLLFPKQDTETVMDAIEDTRRALPFSVSIGKNGHVCKTHDGILDHAAVKTLISQC